MDLNFICTNSPKELSEILLEWKEIHAASHRPPMGEQDMPSGVQELRIEDADGGVRYIYFAWLDGKWTDLAPYGNRIPE